MTPDTLLAVMQATWPAAVTVQHGPWLIQNGAGGGKRVSAAMALPNWQPADLPQAVDAMAKLAQPPLFLIRDGDAALDHHLAEQGYRLVDPVVAYAAPVTALTTLPPAPMTTFPHWPPMAIVTDLWTEGGIGPARVAVMQRVTGAKTAILGRTDDRAAGAAFVALHQSTAMLHALEVTPALRRQGSAHNILRAAAVWAQQNGADTLSLVVTAANANARRLYASLGMQPVGQYHYREK